MAGVHLGATRGAVALLAAVVSREPRRALAGAAAQSRRHALSAARGRGARALSSVACPAATWRLTPPHCHDSNLRSSSTRATPASAAGVIRASALTTASVHVAGRPSLAPRRLCSTTGATRAFSSGSAGSGADGPDDTDTSEVLGEGGGLKTLSFAFSAPETVVDRLTADGAGLHAHINGAVYEVSFKKRGATREVIDGIINELRELRTQMLPLATEKKALDVKAGAVANRKLWACLAYLVLQGATVAKLTFFSRFGWDVMEPITYMLGFTTAIGALSFFQYHRIEYTYPALYNLLARRAQAKLYAKAGFPEVQYNELRTLIQQKQAALRAMMPADSTPTLADAQVVQPRWLCCVDEVTGMEFYYHTLTGESRLRRPADYGLHFEMFSDAKTGAS